MWKRNSFRAVPASLDRFGRRPRIWAMGFNRRKMENQRRQAAETEAAARRATDTQVLEDAERLIAAWNERQAKRMPMLFAPTIGAALTARHWFLWVYVGPPRKELSCLHLTFCTTVLQSKRNARSTARN